MPQTGDCDSVKSVARLLHVDVTWRVDSWTVGI